MPPSARRQQRLARRQHGVRRTPRRRPSLSVGAIYEKANAGVVEITVTSNAAQGDSTFPFGEQQGGSQQAQGSGFVYDTAGHVITNYHVVEGATSLEVTLADGSTYDATVVGTDPSTDLAVLKVDAPTDKLHPLALADSSDVAVGDGVVAIGSPYGLEEHRHDAASSARSTARSSRRTATRSRARSRRTPRSTTATRAARS